MEALPQMLDPEIWLTSSADTCGQTSSPSHKNLTKRAKNHHISFNHDGRPVQGAPILLPNMSWHGLQIMDALMDDEYRGYIPPTFLRYNPRVAMQSGYER
ncbi:uncharacterized protein V6R79_014546 [Siganus canaliculatus]